MASVANYNLKKLIVLILLTSVLSSCKTGGVGRSFFSASNSEKKIANDLKFIDAIAEKNSGNYEKSIVLFEEILKSKDNPAPAHFELSKLYWQKSNDDKAIQHINSAVDLNPKNKWFVNYKIELTKKLALYDECEKTYKLRKKLFPSSTDYEIEFSDFYITRKKYSEALKLYDDLEKRIGISHEININKFLIYKGLDEYGKCEEEIKKLIQTFPAKTNYYIQYADFKLEHGESEKAFEIYNEALQVVPNNPSIYNEMARYYLSDHEEAKAFDLYGKILADPSYKASYKIDILRKFSRLAKVENRIHAQTKKFMEIASKTHPYNPQLNNTFADFLYEENSFAMSASYYKVVVDLRPNNYRAWQQLVLCYYNSNDYENMIQSSEDALELFPTLPQMYFYNGMGLIQKKEYEKSIEVLEEGNDLVLSSDKGLKAQFLSSLGDAYHALKDHIRSDEYFDLSLEVEPKNYYVLNNYAYYLSERNISLEKAKKMSRLSNSLKPEEASFQDTYGWILYQLGEFDDALNWLKKSEINGGNNSGVINEHLGDVYQKLGNLKMAKTYWEKAFEIGDASDELKIKLNK